MYSNFLYHFIKNITIFFKTENYKNCKLNLSRLFIEYHFYIMASILVSLLNLYYVKYSVFYYKH